MIERVVYLLFEYLIHWQDLSSSAADEALWYLQKLSLVHVFHPMSRHLKLNLQSQSFVMIGTAPTSPPFSLPVVLVPSNNNNADVSSQPTFLLLDSHAPEPKTRYSNQNSKRSRCCKRSSMHRNCRLRHQSCLGNRFQSDCL